MWNQVKFHLGTKKKLFMDQLRKDANFLASLNIMDYSLLIGIHDKTRLGASPMVLCCIHEWPL